MEVEDYNPPWTARERVVLDKMVKYFGDSRTDPAVVREPETPSPRWDPHYPTRTLFGSLQSHWPPQIAHHPPHCSFLVLAAVTMLRRDPPDVIFTQKSVAARAHPPCPSTGTKSPCSSARPAAQCSCVHHHPLRLEAALPQLRHNPRVDLNTLHSFSRRLTRSDRFPHHTAWHKHVVALSATRPAFLSVALH